MPAGGDWLQRRWVDSWRVIEVGSKAFTDQVDVTRIPGFLSPGPLSDYSLFSQKYRKYQKWGGRTDGR